jgi:glycerol-3-phosphate acyltransferase PlsY
LKKASKDGVSVLGIGAAACVACCAGPILAFLGGLGIAGVASTLLIGATGLLITVAAVAAIVVMRRRRTSCAVPDDGPVAVAIPTRRAPTT